MTLVKQRASKMVLFKLEGCHFTLFAEEYEDIVTSSEVHCGLLSPKAI
jgi:hypothetical protein